MQSAFHPRDFHAAVMRHCSIGICLRIASSVDGVGVAPMRSQ
jgi:hypothetical protein